MTDLIETLKSNLEDMAYNDYHINAGIDRRVDVKVWEKNGAKRAYLTINCYTAAGLVANQYVVGKCDDVDAARKQYIGR